MHAHGTVYAMATYISLHCLLLNPISIFLLRNTIHTEFCGQLIAMQCVQVACSIIAEIFVDVAYKAYIYHQCIVPIYEYI